MLPCRLFVPERVTNRICTAPWPVVAWSVAAVLTVTSSTESIRGLTRAKNPSVVFRWLSCALMPSMVMLIALCGRPLTVESRLPPAC